MKSCSFLHAADLHLDATFKGLSSGSAESRRIRTALQQATFTALSRLVELAISEQVDAVLLAGDVYNHEDGSLKAQFALRDSCAKLAAYGIRVCIVHGNHDPAESCSSSIVWPENVTIFGTRQPETVEIFREDDPVMTVQGISHAKEKENRNLAKLFSRSNSPLFQVGLLHCTVDNAAKADRYAPCSVADLLGTGMDYLALGHVHEKQSFGEARHIVYSGNIQGLHINESGPRGCYIVRVSESAAMEKQFFALGPVRWETLVMDCAPFASIDALDRKLTDKLDAALAALDEQEKGLVVRFRLQGRSSVDSDLRRDRAVADLVDRLRDNFSHHTPFVWIKDILLETTPDVDFEQLRKRDDLLGESLRQLDVARTERGDFLEEAIAPLFTHRRVKKALGDLAVLSEEQKKALLDDAEQICLDLLEAE